MARRRHLAVVERKPGTAARRLELERALAATEARFRSVEDQIAHLTRIRRILDRDVRVLRLVIAFDAPASSPRALLEGDRPSAGTG